MRDIDVRNALKSKVLKSHIGDQNTLVLDELGLRHGVCRVDIAVVNGFLHGYEIKSDADTLDRLDSQVAIYSSVLDKATLVVGERHADKLSGRLPAWWGIKVASAGERQAVHFFDTQRPKQNPEINPVALCELLWRPEVVEILRQIGATEAFLRRPRAALYQALAEEVELDVLRPIVRERLKVRANWRGQKPPLSDGD